MFSSSELVVAISKSASLIPASICTWYTCLLYTSFLNPGLLQVVQDSRILKELLEEIESLLRIQVGVSEHLVDSGTFHHIGAVIRPGHGIGPVSYTHLSITLMPVSSISTTGLWSSKEGGSLWITPVSYTHLDVYKRQM